MEEKLIHQKHLPPKKRCYALAFTDHETETETSPSRKQLCCESNQVVKTEDKDDTVISGIKPLQSDSRNPDQPIEVQNPTSALFAYIKSSLGGDREVSEVQLIMQRKLEKSDIDSHQSRLAIPGDKIINTRFLSDSEEGWLQLKNGKGEKNRLGVKVFGSSLLPEHDLDLTRWNYDSKGKKYVLNNGWNQFRKENALEEDQLIQLWSFRHKGRVCFAIVRLEKGKGKEREMKMKKKIRPIQRYLAALKWKTRPRSRRVLVQPA